MPSYMGFKRVFESVNLIHEGFRESLLTFYETLFLSLYFLSCTEQKLTYYKDDLVLTIISYKKYPKIYMIKHFDHITLVVKDVEAAKQFFGLLGFQEDKSVVIAGQQFSAYMGVDGIEAEHVTLVLANVSPRTEVQLLKYHHPAPLPDSAIGNLTKLGFNHVCFAVDNLEAELARLKVKGVQLRNEVMVFQNRKLVFLSGPEGITVELAEWSSVATTQSVL
jgi:catechol 2,3-dioxygenase-like lactoylglutathione lyase family enzyme